MSSSVITGSMAIPEMAFALMDTQQVLAGSQTITLLGTTVLPLKPKAINIRFTTILHLPIVMTWLCGRSNSMATKRHQEARQSRFWATQKNTKTIITTTLKLYGHSKLMTTKKTTMEQKSVVILHLNKMLSTSFIYPPMITLNCGWAATKMQIILYLLPNGMTSLSSETTTRAAMNQRADQWPFDWKLANAMPSMHCSEGTQAQTIFLFLGALLGRLLQLMVLRPLLQNT